MRANLEVFTNDKYKLLKWISDNEVQYRKAKYLSSSQQEIAETLHYSKCKTNKYMNELIELNFLKKYKQRGKYSLTKQGYDAIEIIEKIGIKGENKDAKKKI